MPGRSCAPPHGWLNQVARIWPESSETVASTMDMRRRGLRFDTRPTETSIDTSPPSPPTGLTATAAGSGQVNLNWTASNDNVGVSGYRVERFFD